MVTMIRRSTTIVSFLSLLFLSFTLPQHRHLGRIVELLVLTPRRKTLSQLAQGELQGVDASNLADFFRISPWTADDLRLALLNFILTDLAKRVKNPNAPIYLTIDDSLTIKDPATHKLQSVAWHFDHNRHRPMNGGVHVVVGIHWGDFHFPLLWRLYLREQTVRRLRRQDPECQLKYKSKLTLADEMLEQISLPLPKGPQVYVLFDSWYTSAKLVRAIRRRGWHVIAGLKSNRNVNGQKLTTWHKTFKGQRYQQVRLSLAHGRHRTYWVRDFQGRLRDVPGETRIIISQTGPRAHAPRYFLCTDITLSAQEVLRRYQQRWSQEVDYWQVKLQLGLGDFRLQSYEAIEKWYAAVYCTLSYLYWQKYEYEKEKSHTTSLAEVMSRMRISHQEEVLRAACAEVAAGASVEDVVRRYIKEPTHAA